MPRNVSILLATLVAASLAASGAAISVPTHQVTQAPATRRASIDLMTIPGLLSYQGKLTDSMGIPVPDSAWPVRFALYTEPVGGTPFWTENQPVETSDGLFHVLLGSENPIPSVPEFGDLFLGMRVGADAEMTPRLRIVSAAYSYLSERAADADRLQGNDTGSLDARYVNEAQANSVTSGMMVDGTIVAADLNQMGAGTGQALKWTGSAWAPRNDSVGGGTVTSVSQGTGIICTPDPITTSGTVAFDQGWGASRYVNEGQPASGDLGGSYPNPVVDGLQGRAVASSAPGTNQVLKWSGSQWAPADDSAGTSDNAWVRGTSDSVLYTVNFLGIARGDAGNVLYGNNRHTHANFGVECTTGTSGQDYRECTVGGGWRGSATGSGATVGGGYYNATKAAYGGVFSGYSNLAGDAVGDTGATVCGGYENTATSKLDFVGGGRSNTASGPLATVGGGYENSASASLATVAGGQENIASGTRATVGGGARNRASGTFATVPGGWADTAAGNHSFAAGQHAVAGHDGCFVWGDYSTSNRVASSAVNQWRARCAGGVWFYSNSSLTSGVVLASGSNAWSSVCDSASKEDFRPVDKRALLERLAQMRVRDYKMKAQDDGTRHIGPVAQDFAAAFGYGESDKAINSMDAIGVSLAAIQALYEDNKALHAELEALKAELKRK
jgi:hypothetical protein